MIQREKEQLAEDQKSETNNIKIISSGNSSQKKIVFDNLNNSEKAVEDMNWDLAKVNLKSNSSTSRKFTRKNSTKIDDPNNGINQNHILGGNSNVISRESTENSSREVGMNQEISYKNVNLNKPNNIVGLDINEYPENQNTEIQECFDEPYTNQQEITGDEIIDDVERLDDHYSDGDMTLSRIEEQFDDPDEGYCSSTKQSIVLPKNNSIS